MHGDMLIQASELALAMMATMLICLMHRNAAAAQWSGSVGEHGCSDKKR